MTNADLLALVKNHVPSTIPKHPSKLRDDLALMLMNDVKVKVGDVILYLVQRVEEAEKKLAAVEDYAWRYDES